jgi:hypothetical protein
MLGGTMNRCRSWFALVTFCFAATFITATVFGILLATATLAFAGGQASNDLPEGSRIAVKSYSGMVTDSSCGARHLKNSGMSPTECARDCVRKGAKYVLIDGEQTYVLKGEPTKLLHFVGERATVTGNLDGNVIRVSSVNPSP